MKDEMEWVQLLTYMYWNDVYKNDTKNNTKHNTKNKNNNTKRMKILAVNHFSDSMLSLIFFFRVFWTFRKCQDHSWKIFFAKKGFFKKPFDIKIGLKLRPILI